MKVSVTTKIFLSLTGVLVTFAGVAIYSIFTLQSIGAQLEVVDEGYIPLTKVAAELEALSTKTFLDLKELQSVRDRKNLDILRRLYPQSIAARVSSLLRRGTAIVDLARQRRFPAAQTAFFFRIARRLARVKRQHQDNVSNLNRLFAVLRLRHAPELRRVRERLRRGEKYILSAVRAISAELEGRITATVLGVRRQERTSAWVVMGLAVLAAAIGLILVLYAQFTLRPIKRLTDGVARIAGGDYTSRVDIKAQDEIGVLATEFNRMAESLLERDRRLGEQRRELQDAYAALEREKRFTENILESMRSALVVADTDGRVTALNAAATQLLAMEEGVRLGEQRALAEVAALDDALRQALAGREVTIEAAELPDSRYFDLKLAPLLDAEGTVQGALLIADDVTERVRTKEQLVKSERLAAVGRIAAQITHEIRNPLSSIGLNAELLGEEVSSRVGSEGDGSEARALVNSIAREVDRLTEVTEEYLRYARLPQPRFQRVQLNEILTDLLDFLDEELRGREVESLREIQANLAEVDADENQLRQAFLNLMRNSYESMREGGTLRIVTEGDTERVTVRLSDTGAGIDEKHLPRIFDPFFSTKDGGTGLGLALTHQIIEEHGGTIQCQSKVGRGTTFEISFPAAGPG